MRLSEDVIRNVTFRIEEIEEGPSVVMQGRGDRGDRGPRGPGSRGPRRPDDDRGPREGDGDYSEMGAPR